MKWNLVNQVSVCVRKGSRRTMEDAHLVYEENDTTSVFAVFDGHGGRQASTFLLKNFKDTFSEQLKSSATIEDALTNCFEKLHKNYDGPSSVGSTISVVVISKDGDGKLWLTSANAGDSRAVFSQSSSMGKRISQDHNTFVSSERERVTKEYLKKDPDGVVSPGWPFLRDRLYGMVSVLRGVGDTNLFPLVTWEPYISKQMIDEHSQFLILACDGLFEGFGVDMKQETGMETSDADKDAVAFVRNGIFQGDFSQDGACEALVEASLSQGSTDNVTAILVFFQVMEADDPNDLPPMPARPN